MCVCVANNDALLRAVCFLLPPQCVRTHVSTCWHVHVPPRMLLQSNMLPPRMTIFFLSVLAHMGVWQCRWVLGWVAGWRCCCVCTRVCVCASVCNTTSQGMSEPAASLVAQRYRGWRAAGMGRAPWPPRRTPPPASVTPLRPPYIPSLD